MAAKRHNGDYSDLSQLKRLLPTSSYSLTGKAMEPINLIVVGSLSQIKKSFNASGWFFAEKLGPLSLIKAFGASIFNRSYKKGPFSPSYINGRKFMLGIERPTVSDTFRRRHHLRLWKTPYRLNGQPVWVGTASYDRSVGLSSHGVPTHHIAPSLQWEENFLAGSLGQKPIYFKLADPVDSRLQIGDHYQFNGQALVLDLSRAQSAHVR